MLFFKRFYRNYGFRRIQHLQSPPINNLAGLILPRASVFHYLPEDSVTKGIPSDHWAVKDSARLVMVDHVKELSPNAREGNPRRNAVLADTEIKQYHRRHRKLKLVRDLARNTRDPRTPLVVNYALLPELYRYMESIYTAHYKLTNINGTLFNTIGNYVERLDREHFVTINLPTPIPTLTEFRRAETNLNRQIMAAFNSAEHLLILELWKWLGPNRDKGQMAVLSETTLQRLNFIIIHDNKWILFNLGVIDQWRRELEAEVPALEAELKFALESHPETLEPGLGDKLKLAFEANDESIVKPDALQKRFLRILMALFESTTPVTDVSDAELVEEKQNSPLPEVGDDKEGEIEEVSSVDTLPPEAPDTQEDVRRVLREEVVTDDEIEAELDALRKIVEEAQQVTFDDPFVEVPVTLTDGVMNRAEELAGEGVISAAEYKRYEKIAATHKEIKNPYTGKGSLLDFAKIEPEELTIETPEVFSDNPAVIDKSMLASTVHDFDRRYIKDVLKRDVVRNVMTFNRAGVAVTDYQVEAVEDIANEYEIHTVKLTPVSGKSSTIRFKLPVIKEDGTYVANGVLYRSRKQRADLPIRKVRPNKVALTSYYGKVFVERSEKVVHDYGQWLIREIRSAGLNKDDPRITELRTARSVNSELKLPRLYSILGSAFVSFNAGGIEFFFNYARRLKHFGEAVVNVVEVDGLVMVGTRGKVPVVVDDNNTLYLSANENLEVLGKIEDVVQFDRSGAPVDVAELLVFGKAIPLGVVLAYHTGLQRLIANLPGEVKRVPAGEKIQLSDSEFAIRFEDESLVVSREDRLASLILGGFNNYKKSLRRYSIHDFNKKAVYLNVLDDFGLGNRHLRELDLMHDMFIDPITEDILKEMSEPTTWLGLLRRSVELLLTDYSPQEVDLEFMRIRGYERIAGAVYLEMVKSMRGYTAREGTANASVDMKPFAVWETINSDPSKVQVEESNPIKNINEKESVTFTGVGGRGKTSMVKRTRVFGRTDMGTISEATVDSGDVAINTYTSANPKFANLRGITKRYDPANDGAASVLSTGALLSPAADTDDPKRVKNLPSCMGTYNN